LIGNLNAVCLKQTYDVLR